MKNSYRKSRLRAVMSRCGQVLSLHGRHDNLPGTTLAIAKACESVAKGIYFKSIHGSVHNDDGSIYTIDASVGGLGKDLRKLASEINNGNLFERAEQDESLAQLRMDAMPTVGITLVDASLIHFQVITVDEPHIVERVSQEILQCRGSLLEIDGLTVDPGRNVNTADFSLRGVAVFADRGDALRAIRILQKLPYDIVHAVPCWSPANLNPETDGADAA